MKELFIGAMMIAGVAKAQSLNQTASFSTGGGNGGDAVVCGNKVYMLDYVERFELDMQFETSGSTYDIVERVSKGIESLDLNLSQSIKSTLLSFKKGESQNASLVVKLTDTIDYTDMKLLNLEDEGSFEHPTGCKVEQAIIRKEPSPLSKQEFVVQLDLWKKMSTFQRAVAIIHEGTYKYILSGKQNNSSLAREVNMSIFQGDLQKLSDRDFQELLLTEKMTNYINKDGVTFSPDSRKTYDSFGNLTRLESLDTHVIKVAVEQLSREVDSSEVIFTDGIVSYFITSLSELTNIYAASQWSPLSIDQDDRLYTSSLNAYGYMSKITPNTSDGSASMEFKNYKGVLPENAYYISQDTVRVHSNMDSLTIEGFLKAKVITTKHRKKYKFVANPDEEKTLTINNNGKYSFN